MDITTKEIKATLGGANILKGISIDVHSKKFIGIIGPNGCGKSTFLKCVYRVLKPTNGVIKIGDDRLADLSIKESAKKMGVVAQHNFYNFDFAVEEVVLMGRSPHKKSLERDNANDFEIVNECLEIVGLSEFKKRSFSTLSGGEQQRVILARALAQKTQCLILDEPTNHLDIKYQLQLLDIIKSLDLTVLVAIHDLNIAAMYCDYIYVLKQGAVVAQGSPKNILSKELIKEVYEVESSIFTDDNGIIQISYQPLHAMKNKS